MSTSTAARPLRVLIVDDSVVMRRMLSEAVEGERSMEVAGTASNGKLALQRCAQLMPDVITLDLEMPEMDGLSAIEKLKAIHPRSRIIICSSISRRGAEITMEALRRGADDYITKPSGAGGAASNIEKLRLDLMPKIRQFFPAEFVQAKATTPMRVAPKQAPVSLEFGILAIAVSTGGPTALADLIPRLPATFPLPIVIVQHMPPTFTAFLAERLAKTSQLKVTEAKNGDQVAAGSVLIAPGGYHMKLVPGGSGPVVALNEDPPENSCRPAADVLFRSVAELYPKRSMGLILTGMGQDGVKGLQAMKGTGSYVIAQDEASSVVWGMPGEAVRVGVVDAVVPLQAISSEILRQVGGSERRAWQ